MYFELTESFRILGINSAYDYHWDSNFQFLGERHPFWETVCVLSGKVEVAEDETVFILGPGDFVFHMQPSFTAFAVLKEHSRMFVLSPLYIKGLYRSSCAMVFTP